MRVAVYAPARDEAHNVEAWAASAVGADEVVLVDTGSEDGTLEVAAGLGLTVATVAVTPWRFDDGRNAALWHVSREVDVCIALDLDERLEPGWREALEAAYDPAAGQYTYHLEWAPTVSFRADKIHARSGVRWVGAAHEWLESSDGIPRAKVDTEVRARHERGARNEGGAADRALIHLAYAERPSPRTAYYSGREFYYANEWGPARDRLTEYLAMPGATYDQERSEACRFISRMVYPDQVERWLLRACYEAPSRREPWVELGVHYRTVGNSEAARYAIGRALAIEAPTPNNSFHLEESAWNDEALRAIWESA